MLSDQVQLDLGRRVAGLHDALSNLLEALAPETAGTPLHAAITKATATLAEFDRYVAEAAQGEDLTRRHGR